MVASGVLLAIFTVGTGQPKGVPRPVENSTSCAPDRASAVEATRSFPGALSRLRPGASSFSAYFSTPVTGPEPLFWVQPRALSSSVVMPPALLPGEGFSYTGM